MNISDKITQISKYCGSYYGHASMIDERNDGAFNVTMPEENEIRSEIDKLDLIILTGEAGDGKSRILKNLNDILERHSFEIIEDFSAISEERKKILIDKIDKVILSQNKKRLIIAANVGVFTQSILRYNANLLNRIIGYKDKVKIVNFENRNLAFKKTLFYEIVEKFLNYDNSICSNKICQHHNKCIFKNNIDKLLSPVGMESIRVLCDVIYLIGGHITFRELLSLIAFSITFGQDCKSLGNIDNTKIYSYYNIFDYSEDILLSKFSLLDPAKKRIIKDSKINYSNYEDYSMSKRKNFFDSAEKYSLIFSDYIEKFKMTIDYVNTEPYFFDVKTDNNILKDVKAGLSKIISQNNTDIGMFISDTPTIIGNRIKTEFEININAIDSVWHSYDFDFKTKTKTSLCNAYNKFYLSFVYLENDDYKKISMVIDYKLFRYLLMVKDDIFLSKSNASLEEYTINTFFRKILYINPESYKKMKINFNTEGNAGLVNLKLELYEMNKLLFGSMKKIKISKEN